MGSQSLGKVLEARLLCAEVPVLKVLPEFFGHNGTFPSHGPFFSMGSQSFEPCQICQTLSDLRTEVSQR